MNQKLQIKSTIYFILILAITGCKFENIDDDPALLIGTDFYNALKEGDVKKSLVFFAPEFKKDESEWPRLLSSIQSKAGVVTSADLRSSQMVANDNLQCWLLNYSVRRPGSASDEKLLVCRSQDKKIWLISGHALTRLDTNQSVTGGLMPATVSLSMP